MDKVQQQKLIESFCGYGNPISAKIFFMGIEEHDTLLDQERRESFFRNLEAPEGKCYSYKLIGGNGNANGTTERMQRYIYKQLYGNSKDDGEIFQNEIHCFNLYPLGAKNLNEERADVWKSLGYSFKAKDKLYKYFDDSKRPEILKEFIKEMITDRNKLLFVFGKSCWKESSDLLPSTNFQEFDLPNKKGKSPSAVRYSNNKKIWLTGHPSYGWLNEEVVQEIKRIIVKPSVKSQI